jgi:Spy/CpxP family protein refolding chaperone
MRRAVTTFVGCAVLVAGLASAAQAQPFRGMQGQLDLTEEQQAQIKELQARHNEAARAARAEIIKAEAEIQALMLDPDRDLAALERAMKAKSNLEIEERIRALGALQEYRTVLTEEQLAVLGNMGREAFGRGRNTGGRFGVVVGGRGSRVVGRSGRAGVHGRSMRNSGRSGRAGVRGRSLRVSGRSGRAGVRGRSLRDSSRSGRAGVRNQPMGRGRGIPPQAGAGFGPGPNRGQMGRPSSDDVDSLRGTFQRRMRTRQGAAVPPPSAGDR